MDSTEFDRLVRFTKQAFLSRHQPEWDEPPTDTRVRVYRKVLPERGRDEFLRSLIAKSTDNKVAWDSVKAIGESLLRDADHLPDELAEWIADVLTDQRKPKKQQRRPRPTKGGSPEANHDWVICGAIHHIGVRFGLEPTRNGAGPPECCAEGGSACDVVGRAVFGRTVTAFKNTERIWNKRDPVLSYRIRQES